MNALVSLVAGFFTIFTAHATSMAKPSKLCEVLLVGDGPTSFHPVTVPRSTAEIVDSLDRKDHEALLGAIRRYDASFEQFKAAVQKTRNKELHEAYQQELQQRDSTVISGFGSRDLFNEYLLARETEALAEFDRLRKKMRSRIFRWYPVAEELTEAAILLLSARRIAYSVTPDDSLEDPPRSLIIHPVFGHSFENQFAYDAFATSNAKVLYSALSFGHLRSDEAWVARNNDHTYKEVAPGENPDTVLVSSEFLLTRALDASTRNALYSHQLKTRYEKDPESIFSIQVVGHNETPLSDFKDKATAWELLSAAAYIDRILKEGPRLRDISDVGFESPHRELGMLIHHLLLRVKSSLRAIESLRKRNGKGWSFAPKRYAQKRYGEFEIGIVPTSTWIFQAPVGIFLKRENELLIVEFQRRLSSIRIPLDYTTFADEYDHLNERTSSPGVVQEDDYRILSRILEAVETKLSEIRTLSHDVNSVISYFTRTKHLASPLPASQIRKNADDLLQVLSQYHEF